MQVVGRSEASRSGSVGLALTETGAGLRRAVRRQLGDGAAVAFKMICNGAVLRDEAALDEQRVANNALVLVVLSATDPEVSFWEELFNLDCRVSLIFTVEFGYIIHGTYHPAAYIRERHKLP